MRPDHQEFADGVKMTAIAAVSAALTATLVIGAGRILLPSADAVAEPRPELTLALEPRSSGPFRP